jgi:hypothetical protein
VVHTAVAKLLAEVFMPTTMPESIACRPGGGAHRGLLAIQRSLRQHRFALHLDVRAYFASVDLGILRGLVAQRIRDEAFLEVLDRIFASGAGLLDSTQTREWLGLGPDWPPPRQGLPVGATTSQLLATHVYLCGLDHFVKRELKVPAYVRYVDDLLLFGDRREDMRRWREEIGRWLWRERRLRLKYPQARVLSCAGHFDALGARVTRAEIRPLGRAMRRFEARVRGELRRGSGPGQHQHLERSMAASVGLLVG